MATVILGSFDRRESDVLLLKRDEYLTVGSSHKWRMSAHGKSHHAPNLDARLLLWTEKIVFDNVYQPWYRLRRAVEHWPHVLCMKRVFMPVLLPGKVPETMNKACPMVGMVKSNHNDMAPLFSIFLCFLIIQATYSLANVFHFGHVLWMTLHEHNYPYVMCNHLPSLPCRANMTATGPCVSKALYSSRPYTISCRPATGISCLDAMSTKGKYRRKKVEAKDTFACSTAVHISHWSAPILPSSKNRIRTSSNTSLQCRFDFAACRRWRLNDFFKCEDVTSVRI